ncbi:hypothetical protein HYS96_00990 [Candidatus Daviesbacteria bacterium]|nr:hypothetical protein [Candidatus Daviesbacteria bacterium]
MPISKEVIARIIDFHPGEAAKGGRAIDLGEIEEGIKVVYDLFPYQRRAVALQGEPLVLAWTRQPVVALITRAGITPLPYAADVRAIGEELAVKVVDRLDAVRARQI